MILGLAGLAMLSACSEKEEILVGEREDIYAVLEGGGAQADTVPENRALAIRLPRMRTNAEWTHSISTPAYRTDHPALNVAPQPIWSAPIGAGDGKRNRIVADPVVAAGKVFTLDANATVAATSVSGETVWTRDLTPPNDNPDEATGGGLAYGKGVLYVTSGFGTLTAIDPTSGAIKWQQMLNASGSGAPTYYKGLVYVTSGDDTAWAIEADTGRIRWQLTSTPDNGNVLGAPAPALTDKYAVFGYGDGEVQAAFRQGGMRMWISQLAGQQRSRALSKLNDITGDPVIDGNTVYVGSNAGRMAALDLNTGERKWTAREGALGPMWPAGGSVFAVTVQNELVRLDARDGTRIWGVKLPHYVKHTQKKATETFANMGPVLAGGQIIVASNDGKIRFFNPQSGALVRSIDIPGGATTAPVIAGGVMYVVSTQGQLYAFR
ncbi:MAG: quinoprotein [Rhodobacteraceae bacterium]|nr:quinoprotein [Paracoccaceae bacterium]MBT24814.1 quinoprotein [Paracoccaceae bacterium]